MDAEENDTAYLRPQQLTLITMHRAKGLDWDLVFLPFLHERNLPGESWIPTQSQFLGRINLAEAARAQLRAVVHQHGEIPSPSEAWDVSQRLKVSEEFRLLYVAMTRARRFLWLSAAQKAPFSWRRPEHLEPQKPCPVVPSLEKRFSHISANANKAAGDSTVP